MQIYDDDTIAAVATRAGESAIGIVRLSGKKAIQIADDLFNSNSGKNIRNMKTFTMAYGKIEDSRNNIIDEVIVTVMKSPKSYTKEDVVEINCHGGLVATNKVLELCLEKGARIAQPGEFTKRAFLNGRIDLTQAESVIESIQAKTEASLKIAARNTNGLIGKKINKIRKRILDVLVELEASIDFIEEDLEITPYRKLTDEVKKIHREILLLIEDEKKSEIIKNGIKIAIIGKPNVGKSSLLNILTKKEKAIVTEIPGTTRDAVEEILLIKGIPLILTDTAGIRKTKDQIEKIGVKKAINHIKEAELIIFMLDWSRELDEDDKKIMRIIRDKKHVICINKIDLDKKIDINALKKIDNIGLIKLSILKDKGIDELENRIKETVLGEEINLEERILINSRHKNILLKSLKYLKNAEDSMENELSEEFPSSDLRIAYDILGEILGKTVDEDILDGIFSKFCIGK